ncbi:Hpt domain-containing protein [Rhodobacter sp.]
MIDWGRLADLRAEIGDADLSDVVRLFLEEADEIVSRLNRGIPDAQLQAELHFLKGAALNLGLKDLARLCQEGERQADQHNAAGVDVARIVTVYQASRAAYLGALAESQTG